MTLSGKHLPFRGCFSGSALEKYQLRSGSYRQMGSSPVQSNNPQKVMVDVLAGLYGECGVE